MATPRVFVSSTCYDLKYIRDNLRYFITTLGYEPILSEDGAVFFDPASHTHDSCLTEIPNCQLFVLIIGGRYGGKFQGTNDSITNMEYREAIKNKIPIFTLVESGVYHDHNTFNKNKNNTEIDLSKFHFPSSDSVKIFDFIDEVRKASSNNALIPFRDFNEIESYLKKQWSGMMFKFLTENSAAQKVQDTLHTLKEMNEKIEFLSGSIFNQIASDKTKHIAHTVNSLKNSEFYKLSEETNKLPEVNIIHFISSNNIEDYLDKLKVKVKDFEIGDLNHISNIERENDYTKTLLVPREVRLPSNRKITVYRSLFFNQIEWSEFLKYYDEAKTLLNSNLLQYKITIQEIESALNYAEIFN